MAHGNLVRVETRPGVFQKMTEAEADAFSTAMMSGEITEKTTVLSPHLLGMSAEDESKIDDKSVTPSSAAGSDRRRPLRSPVHAPPGASESATEPDAHTPPVKE